MINENTGKSIISALSGAIIVLLVAFVVLQFTHVEEKKEEVRAIEAVLQPVEKVKSEPVAAKVIEPAGEVTEAFDAFGILDSPKTELDEDSLRKALKENKTISEVTKPISEKSKEESTKDLELAKLESLLSNKKSKAKSLNKNQEDNRSEPSSPITKKEIGTDDRVAVITASRMEKQSGLEKFILNGSEFLNITPSVFNNKWLNKLDAVWTDNIRSSARTDSELQFADFTSLETVFTFRKEKLNKVTMMVYNKGDIGLITRRSFEKATKGILDKMTAVLGKKPLFKPNAGITRNNIYFWNIDNVLYKLEYSFSETSKDFLSEYIRVVVTKGSPGINVINIDQINTNVLTEADLRSLVTREANGDVIINGIPMVDQGKKGYCACAALARLMMYFGRDFDQHDIAKLAEATGDEGSDPKSLKKAIETMSAKLRLNMKVLAKCYLSDTNDSKTKGKLENIKDDQTLNSMNAEIFRTMAFGNRRYKEFEKNVMNSIDRGRPVAWALEVGMIPEKGIPQSSGGHMRIISGYNKSLGVIYYTDTWGAGHEKKTMDMNSAFFVSYAFWEISPR